MMDLGPAAIRTAAGPPRVIATKPAQLRPGVPLLLGFHDLALTLSTRWIQGGGVAATARVSTVMVGETAGVEHWQATLSFLLDGMGAADGFLYPVTGDPGQLWWHAWVDQLSGWRPRYGKKIRYPQYTVVLSRVQHAQLI